MPAGAILGAMVSEAIQAKHNREAAAQARAESACYQPGLTPKERKEAYARRNEAVKARIAATREAKDNIWYTGGRSNLEWNPRQPVKPIGESCRVKRAPEPPPAIEIAQKKLWDYVQPRLALILFPGLPLLYMLYLYLSQPHWK